jgi:hypothetical protein
MTSALLIYSHEYLSESLPFKPELCSHVTIERDAGDGPSESFLLPNHTEVIDHLSHLRLVPRMHRERLKTLSEKPLNQEVSRERLKDLVLPAGFFICSQFQDCPLAMSFQP